MHHPAAHMDPGLFWGNVLRTLTPFLRVRR